MMAVSQQVSQCHDSTQVAVFLEAEVALSKRIPDSGMEPRASSDLSRFWQQRLRFDPTGTSGKLELVARLEALEDAQRVKGIGNRQAFKSVGMGAWLCLCLCVGLQIIRWAAFTLTLTLTSGARLRLSLIHI
eukprot:TRINITY_DN46212_c0_g1_i1.p2 TRINITY_DN46212_c0_g1~~TRINITY_DN46212_c0_g1_i1.p2  ORF type:complete len:132 (-),score=27.05 TRINITY_DN46212_c0_g1_i1:82-477(-)